MDFYKIVNGVTRGNRFRRVTEIHSVDYQQDDFWKWAKNVTPFKELKTSIMNIFSIIDKKRMIAYF